MACKACQWYGSILTGGVREARPGVFVPARERCSACWYTASDGSRWELNENPPPIPVRAYDWSAAENAEWDRPSRVAYGSTRAECLADIEELVEERSAER